MPRALQSFMLLPAIFLMGWGTGAVAQAGKGSAKQPASACRYEAASGIPSWVTTGAAQNNGRFLVVDIQRRKLVEISGRAVADESKSALADLFDGSIVRIMRGKSVSAPIVVGLTGDKLLEVDQFFTPRRRVEMSTAGLQNGGTQMANLLDWIITGDGEAFGYADLSVGDPANRANWRNGFVRFTPQKPDSFRVFREGIFGGDERTWMLLTYPFMASIGSTIFVARIDNKQMGLWRLGPNDSDLRLMNAFPEHLRTNRLAPVLPTSGAIEEYPRTMKVVETANMIAGLYAWDNALFVLSRSFEQGQRRWYLSKIDPLKDKVLWTVALPGAANHVMIIPGDQEWAFLEKGPVTAPFVQTTHHIRFVSSVRLRSSSLKALCN